MRSLLPLLLVVCVCWTSGTAATPNPSRTSPATTGAASEQAPRFLIETVDGTSYSGTLNSIQDDQSLAVLTDEGSKSISLENVLSIGVEGTQTENDQADKANRLLYLSDGSILRAELVPDAPEAAGSLAIFSPPLDPSRHTIPLKAIAAIRIASRPEAPLEAEFDARRRGAAPSRDILIVSRDNKPVVLPGALESLTAREWSFRMGDRTQTAPLEKAYAIILGNPPISNSDARAEVELARGGKVIGSVLNASSTALQVQTASLGDVTIPWTEIRRVAFRSKRIIFVSDLSPATTVQKSLLNISWPLQRDRNVMGGPIIVAGRRYEKGLGLHAFTAVTYELGGQFVQLSATIGIDDAVAPRGSALFRVLLDEKPAFESALITSGQSVPLTLDVTGANKMTLECSPGDDLDLSDHANWAGARLLRADESVSRPN